MAMLIAAAIALVLMLSLIWQRRVRCVDLIEADLRRHHFTGIEAKMAFGGIALRHHTFDVRYVDTRGRKHRNRARVGSSIADAVQWQHRLERPSSPRKAADDAGTSITLEGRLPLISDAREFHAAR